ncbi:thiopurine S-methyltransferase [Kushneria aurantia]|uniref:Thiopurine S-methyltransferase n=1 Tax=Kushneria aurantia TaxID=504092 RepID=A0ABV6G3J5_9GAMM|nr:thiopurine S-methyltransferase [Kushneria aurantia]
MSVTDWLTRWQQGRIGFHRSAVHEALPEHWHELALSAGDRVLVPLCGKSLDMRWLAAHGHPVLGVELSPLALEQFVAAGSEPVDHDRRGGFARSRQGMIELLQGDFFYLEADLCADIAAFYDRAALIALPPATRQRYAHHLAQLMLPASRGLLITLTHDGEGGPPFSVDHDEVVQLLAPNFEVRLCHSAPADDGLIESVWRLRRKSPCC